ncbi:hypothetical protein CRYUN_Cryun01aG0104600 [Craigia yunnanensis]
MRATNTTATIKLWKSPIPFLFGSLAIVLFTDSCVIGHAGLFIQEELCQFSRRY